MYLLFIIIIQWQATFPALSMHANVDFDKLESNQDKFIDDGVIDNHDKWYAHSSLLSAGSS